jgi:5-deoxy-glucuronate isomerase
MSSVDGSADRLVERTPLVRAGDGTLYISLDLIEAGVAARIELAGRDERLVVIMAGTVEVLIDGQAAGIAGRRGDVFDGPGDAIYLPGSVPATLVPVGGPVTVALAAAPPGPSPAGPARVIATSEQRVATVGRDGWRRTVRTILGPDAPASRLLVGETINPPGLWSSYPPHRHDRDSDEEVRLEEVYLFRLKPADGFGVQVRYDSDSEREARMVRDKEVAVITTGFHPVVAAPGYELYYLWVMAGEGRVQRVYIDPRYRWVEAAG